MGRLLIDYTNDNNIILELYEKNKMEIIYFYYFVIVIILKWFSYLLIMPIKMALFLN